MKLKSLRLMQTTGRAWNAAQQCEDEVALEAPSNSCAGALAPNVVPLRTLQPQLIDHLQCTCT